MVLDCCTTPLSPLSHSILMEWCVYKHQEWYPLNSERSHSVYKVLWGSYVVGYVCITLVVCNTIEKMFLVHGFHNQNLNVFGQLVYVEVGSKQRRTISKLLCDHRFRPREVCRKTDYLHSTASFYFLHIQNYIGNRLVQPHLTCLTYSCHRLLSLSSLCIQLMYTIAPSHIVII